MVVTIKEPLVDISGLSRFNLMRALLEMVPLYYEAGGPKFAVLADKCDRTVPPRS